MLPSFDYIMPSLLDSNGFNSEPNISPAHSPNIIRRCLISHVSSSPTKIIPTNNFESLDIKPSNSLNLDDLQNEEKYQKTHIFAYKPPRGLCIPVLHALLRLSMTPRDNGNDKSNSSLFPVYSAIVLPNEPNTIFIECESEQAARNALKHIAELRPIRNMVEITKPQFTNVFLNPIKSLKYHIGKIIQTKTPEFDNEFGQIVDIDPTKGKLLIKILPHIDYNELIMYNLNSQKVLNNKKPPDYKAPSTIFDEHRILGLNLATKNFERKQIRIWDKMFDAIIWDKNTFIGQFQYVWLDFNEVSFPNLIEPIEFERFEKGMSNFERENSIFVTNFNERSNRCISHVFECDDKILEIHKNTGKPSWAPKTSPASQSNESNGNESNTFLNKRKSQAKVRINAFPVKSQEPPPPPQPQNTQNETKSQPRSFLDSDDPDIDEEIINEIENKSKININANSQPQTTQVLKTSASNLQNQNKLTMPTINKKSNTQPPQQLANTQQILNNQPTQQKSNTQQLQQMLNNQPSQQLANTQQLQQMLNNQPSQQLANTQQSQQMLNNQSTQQLANTQSPENQALQCYYRFVDLVNQRNKEQLNELNMQIENQKTQKNLLFTSLIKIEKLNGYGCEQEEEQISRISNELNKQQEDVKQKEDKQVKELLDILNYISPKVVATIQKTIKKALKKPLEDKLSGLETYLRTLEESIKNYTNVSFQSNHNTQELELYKSLTVFQINLTKQRMVLKQQADEIEQSKKPENRINLLLSLTESNQQYAQVLNFELQNQPEKLNRIHEIQRQQLGQRQQQEIQKQFQLQQQQMYNTPMFYQQQQLLNGQNGYQQYFQQNQYQYQRPIQTTQFINQLQQSQQQIQQPIQQIQHPMQQMQQPIQQIQQPMQQIQHPIQQIQKPNSQNIPNPKSTNLNQNSQPISNPVVKKQRVQQKKVKGSQPIASIESYFQNLQTSSQDANAQSIPHLNLSSNQINTINSIFLSSTDQKPKKQTRKNQLNVVVQNLNQKK